MQDLLPIVVPRVLGGVAAGCFILWFRHAARVREISTLDLSLQRQDRLHLLQILACIILVTLATAASAMKQTNDMTLVSFPIHASAVVMTASDAETRLDDSLFSVKAGTKAPWPGVTFAPASGSWDLSACRHVAITLTNRSARSLVIHARLDNPCGDGMTNCVTGSITLGKGAAGTLVLPIQSPWQVRGIGPLIGMRGWPGQTSLPDPSRATQLIVFLTKQEKPCEFAIGSVRASDSVLHLPSSTFFPFIDEFGQFIHADWPGKIHAAADFQNAAKAETKDLDSHPGPAEWAKYGGWAAGPTLRASGFFRVEKHKGSWWLVDPDGHLFWSHGVDCVGFWNATPISDREKYYAALPQSNSLFAKFYGEGSWAPHGYYHDHAPYKTFDFTAANLQRKFGDGWPDAATDLAHRRLRSWGMNTIGNWSDKNICSRQRTPYVATIHFDAPVIEGSDGYWGKFYDVFDPAFASNLATRLAQEKNSSARDPWCIGFFVHNELSWGDDLSLATAALASPAGQQAKQVFMDDLKAKYKSIAALNEQWGSTNASWQALLDNRVIPDKKRAQADLAAFHAKVAETYFRIVRDGVKAIAPNHLYLGCRFAWVNDAATRAAAKYCDVVSYNRYQPSVADLHLPDNIDMPLIIGEFHFGALDRGMFHTGLVPTEDQADRAAHYEAYVRSALANPAIVGTHWFQYHDQATTGRGDGENYQIGFVNICDTPYPETIAAARRVGAEMYEFRSSKGRR